MQVIDGEGAAAKRSNLFTGAKLAGRHPTVRYDITCNRQPQLHRTRPITRPPQAAEGGALTPVQESHQPSPTPRLAASLAREGGKIPRGASTHAARSSLGLAGIKGNAEPSAPRGHATTSTAAPATATFPPSPHFRPLPPSGRDSHSLAAENQTLLYGWDGSLLLDALLDLGDLV